MDFHSFKVRHRSHGMPPRHFSLYILHLMQTPCFRFLLIAWRSVSSVRLLLVPLPDIAFLVSLLLAALAVPVLSSRLVPNGTRT